MKKNALLLLLLFAVKLFSQVTYEASDFTTTSTSYLISYAIENQSLDYEQTGENYIWDYSALGVTTQNPTRWVDPNERTRYKNIWCLSNLFIPGLPACNTNFNNNFNLARHEFERLAIPKLGRITSFEDIVTQFPQLEEIATNLYELFPELEELVEFLNGAIELINRLDLGGFELTAAYSLYNLSDDTFERKMFGLTIPIGGINIPFNISYSDNDVIYQFPMNYDDTFTNTSRIGLDTETLPEAVKTVLPFQLSFSLETERTNHVEGWGAITTPYQTFSNTLKVKSIQKPKLSLSLVGGDGGDAQLSNLIEFINDFLEQFTISIVTYSWFDPDYSIPVMQSSGIQILQNEAAEEEEAETVFIPVAINYIDEERCTNPLPLFLPSPVLGLDFEYDVDGTAVTFYNYSRNFDNVLWDFGDGNQSTELEPTHNYKCPGIHLAKLTLTNEFCEPDTVNAITLPVNIIDVNDLYSKQITFEENLDFSYLTASRDTPGTEYQWVDCDNDFAPISGETNKDFIPNENGHYAVILTTNDCEDMSICYSFNVFSIDENSKKQDVKIYPNPTTGLLNVLLPKGDSIKSIKIHDSFGKLIGDTLDMSQKSSGIYFITLETNKYSITKKVVKL